MKCLVQPRQPDSAESCCLVTPPGYAILDTGCTSTLVGSENEERWSSELKRRTGGALKPEQGDSDVRFEGINGETKAAYRVKYPVRIGSRDGFVHASVIPGKAPFLLSIQALRAMKAKLDCEHDVLEIPGVGKVQLETNTVGHYLLPLFEFQSGHAFVSAEAGLGPDSELVVDEDVARLGDNLGVPPGLDPPGNEGSVAQGPDQGHDAFVSRSAYVPKYSAVRSRTDKYAIGALLRLAKETRGPWVDVSKETPTLYLILGKHAFDKSQNPWKVRAAQIGYRARVLRKPPPHLEEAWVLIMSLVDRRLSVLVDWTDCRSCVGRTLPKVEDVSSKYLFVYAMPPARDSETELPKTQVSEPPQLPSSVSGSAEAFVAACTESRLPSQSLSGPASVLVAAGTQFKPPVASCDSDCESSHSCDDSVEAVLMLEWPRHQPASSLCPLQSSHDRVLRQRDWELLPCSHCRLKCRDCKGRIARVVKSTGEILYAQRKDCAVTPVPGPSGVTLLADGDLVKSPGAPETLDKKGLITYPFV